MFAIKEAGLRSDGELVQAVLDVFEFDLSAARAAAEAAPDKDHDKWIDILTISAPTSRAGGASDDDDGLPDTIIWCIDGNGSSASSREELTITYEMLTREWAVNGEVVDDAGLSALVFLG